MLCPRRLDLVEPAFDELLPMRLVPVCEQLLRSHVTKRRLGGHGSTVAAGDGTRAPPGAAGRSEDYVAAARLLLAAGAAVTDAMVDNAGDEVAEVLERGLKR
jgi:hypothetical protein